MWLQLLLVVLQTCYQMCVRLLDLCNYKKNLTVILWVLLAKACPSDVNVQQYLDITDRLYLRAIPLCTQALPVVWFNKRYLKYCCQCLTSIFSVFQSFSYEIIFYFHLCFPFLLFSYFLFRWCLLRCATVSRHTWQVLLESNLSVLTEAAALLKTLFVYSLV